MARILPCIIFIALATASAYKYPHRRYYQPLESPNYGPSQYSNVDSGSSETDTYNYQGRDRSVQNDQERYADSSQITERSIPFGYSRRNANHENVRVAGLDDVEPRNGNFTKVLHSLPKTYPSVINRRGTDSESAVVFPGPTSATRKTFATSLTDDCGELGICENSPDYPHEYVEKLLAKLPDANTRFYMDVETPQIAQRGGQEQAKSNQSIEFCTPDMKIIYPDKVKTKSGKVVFIINGKDKKVQGFNGAKCKFPGKPCSNLVYVSPNYIHACEQKLMDRNMWAIDANGTMEMVTVPWPSCCMCVAYKT